MPRKTGRKRAGGRPRIWNEETRVSSLLLPVRLWAALDAAASSRGETRNVFAARALESAVVQVAVDPDPNPTGAG